LGVGKKTAQHFAVQIALALKVAIEAAMSQAHSGHNLLQGNIIETVAIEESTSTFDYLRSGS
jgi:hypothetical protein